MLKVPPGSPLTEFFCVSHEVESPHGLARIYIPPDPVPAGVQDGNFPCHETATRFAVLSTTRTSVRETACARPPTPEEVAALRLHTPTPVLEITRVAVDASRRVIEAAPLVFPGDRVDVVATHHPTDERQTQE
ncbi:UTRA domain-containing protein [Streptomyces sp. SID10815]|uniref:UTRA domain-containing protein n=1 Tax=Streptomyces sp. SID10815 TaxID=2706027 RepID=UPI001EF3CC5D|nr:UTRA domain-containing protein [Streptomyces sp. SID10815]